MEHDLPQMMGDLLDHARVTERLHAALSTCIPVTKALSDIQNVDADLSPEILAAVGHVEALVEALTSASRVSDEKFRLALNRTREAYGLDPEGDPQ